MKEKPYMSSNDMLEFLKLAILAGEARNAAEQTKKNAKTPKEKDWAKRMAIAATHMAKVTDERLECMEHKQLLSLKRRWNNSDVRLYTTDQLRVEDRREKPIVEDRTICYEDWCYLGELALMHCNLCPQGKYVKDCEYRQMFHRVGIPVGREEVHEGQCEFRCDDYIRFTMPQGGEDIENNIRRELEKIASPEAAAEAKQNTENDKRLFL